MMATFVLAGALTFIDLRHYIIPDEFSIYAVPVGVVFAIGLASLGGAHPAIASGWRDAVLGAFVGGGGLALIMGLYWLVRREEGMGMGDVKLLMMMGAFLGTLPAIPFIMIVSSLAGALVGLLAGRWTRSALSDSVWAFLAFAAILYVLHGPEIMARAFPGLSIVFQ